MALHNKKFIDALRLEFISLLESQRGLQSKLSKSIDKTPSYFSEIKRGNPVNALHLKAVELVLGPEAALNLLCIDNEHNQKQVLKKRGLITQFRNTQKIEQIIEDLLLLEKVDYEEFDEIHQIIKIKLEKKKKSFKKERQKKIS